MIRKVTCLAALAAIFLLGFGGSTALAKGHHHKKKHGPKEAITVKVVDSSGNPVEGAKVHLGKQHHHAKPHKKKHAAQPTSTKKHHKHHVKKHGVTTDASGNATLHAPVGSHRVSAQKKGAGSGHAKAAVTAGQGASVTITLSTKHKHHGHGKKGGKKHHHAPVTPASP